MKRDICLTVIGAVQWLICGSCLAVMVIGQAIELSPGFFRTFTLAQTHALETLQEVWPAVLTGIFCVCALDTVCWRSNCIRSRFYGLLGMGTAAVVTQELVARIVDAVFEQGRRGSSLDTMSVIVVLGAVSLATGATCVSALRREPVVLTLL